MSADLCQYFTPLWVAEALVERHFPRLDMADAVLEPTCGPGAFLRAIPAQVQAVGVEIDAALAQRARDASGRRVIVGDIRTVALDFQPTAVIGNPPFDLGVFEQLLARCHQLLPGGGRAGFILPAYFFQTAATVCRLSESWSVAYELIPRNCFKQGMEKPLLFALFSKDARRSLVGFALYRETADVMDMAPAYREVVTRREGALWPAVCKLALERLGGRAALPEIYGELSRNRPTRTEFWKEKIRQTLRRHRDLFRPLAGGTYELAAA